MKLDSLKEEFLENGLVVLPGMYSDAELEEHSSVVATARTLFDVKDENGFGDRIGQLHQKYPELMHLASKPSLLEFLSFVLKDDPLLFGSLNFEKGSQQAIHVDAIFFWPEPYYSMAGVWIALEDVDMDNGPLMYVPGSHKWEMIRSEDVAQADSDLLHEREEARAGRMDDGRRGELVARMGNAWTGQYLDQMKERDAEPLKIPVKRGDAVIWHSLLAHGGDVIADKSRSRRSVVYHYLGGRSQLFSFERYMLLNRGEFTAEQSESLERRRYGGLDYVSYPYFVTYEQGRQVIHNIEK